MCGIIGIVGQRNVVPSLIECLKRLEYRGYDSAGIATLQEGTLLRRRAEGKLVNLENSLKNSPIEGKAGIGHTRWATHGAPNERNAHPHASQFVAVVHNGIIENYATLKERLIDEGREFESETDTEVVVHLLSHYLEKGLPPEEAFREVLKQLHGAFALAALFKGEENLLLGARRGSPLAIGYGDGEMYIGSDALALAPLTEKVAYLEEDDWVVLTDKSAKIYDLHGQPVERLIKKTALTGAMIGKGNYRHFMLKEIFEQPTVVGDMLHHFLNPEDQTLSLVKNTDIWHEANRITIVACGTSYYAGCVAKYWFEKYTKIPVEVEIASEFRYREPALMPGGIAFFISQSGETADTLAALQYAKRYQQYTYAVVNVPESSIARLADEVFETHAGPEIGVASTKAFIAQLTLLACLVISVGQHRKTISSQESFALIQALTELPEQMSKILLLEEKFIQMAHTLSRAKDILYLARGSSYPIALEGALKMKELSYIHAEGYAAGEMKHGPIALIDDQVPVVVLAPSDFLLEKMASNIQEVTARGGKCLIIGDKESAFLLEKQAIEACVLPKVHPFTAPLLYTLPMQLLAYHTAVLKGTDVDQPRNLAKSVTVE